MGSRKIFGAHGEDLVARTLEQQGYIIIGRNYKKRYGEIDLVATKDDEIVFVEVKTRASCFVEPESLISPAQQKKITITAKTYIAEHNLEDYTCRFDAALLIGISPNQELTYIPNAFTDEE